MEQHKRGKQREDGHCNLFPNEKAPAVCLKVSGHIWTLLTAHLDGCTQDKLVRREKLKTTFTSLRRNGRHISAGNGKPESER